jgi:hypothetical protein
MDAKDLAELVQKYLAVYVEQFVSILRHPKNPALWSGDIKQDPLSIPGYSLRLQEAPLVHFGLSAAIGSSLLAIGLPPVRPISLFTMAAYLLTSWILYAIYTHFVVAKLAGGRELLLRTLTVSLQVSGVCYVIASFLVAVAGLFSGITPSPQLVSANIYLVVHSGLVCVYQTLAIGALHGIRTKLRWAILAVLLPLPGVLINSSAGAPSTGLFK